MQEPVYAFVVQLGFVKAGIHWQDASMVYFALLGLCLETQSILAETSYGNLAGQRKQVISKRHIGMES